MKWYNLLGVAGIFVPVPIGILYSLYMVGGLQVFLILGGAMAYIIGCLYLMYKRP